MLVADLLPGCLLGGWFGMGVCGFGADVIEQAALGAHRSSGIKSTRATHINKPNTEALHEQGSDPDRQFTDLHNLFIKCFC